MTDIRLADVSEWQSSVDASAYLGGGYKCIICRAYSGYRADGCMPGRRDYFRGQPFVAVGYYAYLAKDVDATQQANGFVNTVGTLKGNEFPVLDVEEGSGSQTSRAEAWFKVVDAWAGFKSTLYASSSYFDSYLGGAGHWTGRPLWVAAYPSSYSPNPASEPSMRHDLWQYTDRASMPGISGGVDCNIAHQSAQDFLTTMRCGSAPAPTPAPATEPPESMVQIVGLDGRQYLLVEDSKGKVWVRDQGKENAGTWQAWKSLGTPGGK